jgi:adenine-specific DNA-methyltransferase
MATVTTPEPESMRDAAPAERGGDDRLLAALRHSPVLRLDGNRTVEFRNIRRPAKTLALSAEGIVLNGKEGRAAFVFGPENGAVSVRLVESAAREARGKGYDFLYVIGFAIDAKARESVEQCEQVYEIPAIYVQATPDLTMGDLLKNMRSSQLFSVCGLPEVKVHALKDGRYQVELLGFDVFDPSTMEVEHRAGGDVPAWFLDTDYSGSCFCVCQAFFPRTGAWDNLKRALRGVYEDSVWDHLAGTTSAPFEADKGGQIAVKVIDDRGNELMVVKTLNGK